MLPSIRSLCALVCLVGVCWTPTLSFGNETFSSFGPVSRKGIEVPQRFYFADNDHIIINYVDHNVLYRISDGKEVFKTPKWGHWGMDIDPSSGDLVTHDFNNDVVYYDTNSENIIEEKRIKEVHPSSYLELSNDGNRLLSGVFSFAMNDTNTGEQLWRVEPERMPFIAEWDQESGVIVLDLSLTFGGSPSMQLISDKTGEELIRVYPGFGGFSASARVVNVTGSRYSILSSPNRRAVIISHTDLTPLEFTQPANKSINYAHTLMNPLRVLGIASRGTVGNFEPEFFIQDIEEDKPIDSLDIARQQEGLTSAITAFALNEDANTLLLGTETGTLEKWDLSENQLLETIGETEGAIVSIKFLADQNVCLTETNQEVVQFWDINTSSKIGEALALEDTILSPDRQWIAGKSSRGYLKIIKSDGSILRNFPSEGDTVISSFYSDDGSSYYLVYRNGSVALFDSDSNQELSREDFGFPFHFAAPKFDNSPFVMGLTENGGSYIVDAITGATIHTFDEPLFVSPVADEYVLSMDGNRLMKRQFVELLGTEFVLFEELVSNKTLVVLNARSAVSDMDKNGNKAAIYINASRNPDPIEVSIGEQTYSISALEEDRELFVLIDLQSGDFIRLPIHPFFNDIEDLEFSTDAEKIYLEEGFSEFWELNIETLEYRKIEYEIEGIQTRPLKALPRPNQSDLLTFSADRRRILLDPDTASVVAWFNDDSGYVTASPKGDRFLQKNDHGLVFHYEERNGTLINSRPLRSLRRRPWSINFDGEEGTFYRLQTSTDLDMWTWTDESIPAYEPNQDLRFNYIDWLGRMFGRVIAFPANSE